jgi:hypothetical protein
MSVSFSDSGLTTMGYEKKMIREDNVKFEGEDGILELTDVRLVWYRKPSKQGGLKKFGAFAGAVAGAALLEGVGSRVGGIGGHAIRSVGHGIGAAAVYSAISSWTQDSFINKDAKGNAESMAIPLVAVSQAQISGNKLVLPLKSGGDMRFEFKQPKVITAIIANISSAQGQGKCPYCGSPSGGRASCSKCGAVLEGGGGGGTPRGSGGDETVTMTGGGDEEQGSFTITSTGSGRGGQPDRASITFKTTGGGGGRGGFCSSCGQPLPAGAKFCNSCGQKAG